MPVCSEPDCVALATSGDKCAIHGIGYHRHDGSKPLRCERCHRKIDTDEWYLRNEELLTYVHVKACKPYERRQP